MRASLMASSSFAHLAGLVRPSAKAKPRKAQDEDMKRRADDGGGDDDPDGKAKPAKAEDDKPNDTKDDDEDDDEEGDDDSDEEDMKGKRGKKAHAASARQQARCRAIFASPQAAANVALAAHFAFETTMTRGEAVRALKAAVGSAATPALADRMAAAGPPRIPANAPEKPAGDAAVAAGWDRAFAPFKPR